MKSPHQVQLRNLSGPKTIIAFFTALFFQILSIAIILINIFDLSLSQILNNQVPQLAQNIYLSILYPIICLDIYYFSPQTFDLLRLNDKFRIILGNLSKGFFLAFFSLLLLYAIELIFSLISFKTLILDFSLITECLILAFLIAFIEELLFRAFIYRKLRESYTYRSSAIISSYIYAQLHFLRFDLSFTETIIPLLSLFLIGYILVQALEKYNLYFCIGMHSAWIFLISYINRAEIFLPDSKWQIISGGLYPVAGLSGLIMSALLLSFFRITEKF